MILKKLKYKNKVALIILILLLLGASPVKEIQILFKDGSIQEYEYLNFNSRYIRIKNKETIEKIFIKDIISFKPKRHLGKMIELDKIIITEEDVYYGYLLSLDSNSIHIGDEYNNYTILLNSIQETLDYESYERSVGMSRLGAFWRSALFPGWGQVYSDRTIGILYSVGFTVGLFSTFYSYTMKENYNSQYISSKYEDENKYTQYKKWNEYMFYSIYFTGIIYTLNLLDVTIFYKNSLESIKYKEFHGIGIEKKF